MKGKANHFPLETANGTIEVAELAYHGRLRSRLPDRALYEDRHGEGFMHEAAQPEEVAPPVPAMHWPVDPGQVSAINSHQDPPLDASGAEPGRPEVAYREAASKRS